MSHLILKFSMILMLTLLLEACTVTDDPRKGGIISGTYNVMTGGYEKRIDNRKKLLSNLQIENDKYKKNSMIIEEEILNKTEKSEVLKSTIAKSNKKNNQIKGEINQLRKDKDYIKNKTLELNKKIEDLDKQILENVYKDRGTIDDLTKKRNLLRTELKILVDIDP